MSELSRREFIKLAGATAAAAGLGGLSTACGGLVPGSAQKELPIFGMWPLTGALADHAPGLKAGMTLALEEFGNKILDRPIKYIERDDETKADVGVRRLEETIESDNVKFLIGPWSSGVAVATADVVKRRKVVNIVSVGTEEISGARCNRYAFQWAAQAYTAIDTDLQHFMRLNPNNKKWYLLIADYAFGHTMEKYVKLLAPKYGIEIVGTDRHPLDEKEMSGYATKAINSGANCVCMANFGLTAVQAQRTLFNFGFTPKNPVIWTWSVLVEEMTNLQQEMCENLWIGTSFYYTIDTPIAKAFVQKYRERYKQPPGYAGGAAYGMTRILLRAIEKAKSTEPADVVKAMEGWEVDDLVGPMKIDAKTHQMWRPYFFVKCKKKAEMKDQYDYGDVVGTGNVQTPDDVMQCKSIGEL
ncbi:MAG: ABC transporter substrate-binding protein [Chloroflexi bacterium]|nr:ABC transporter substrate-binding protein [Chloroflexota bacterium]